MLNLAPQPVSKPAPKPKVYRFQAHKVLALSLLSGMVFSLTLLNNPLVRTQAIAQQISRERQQAFLADPHTDEPRDPLLPATSTNRSYSPLELNTLATQLDQLNQMAQQQLTEGKADEAFELWLRELRLRRVFGLQAELNALRRVATLAWNQQRTVEVPLLTLRTREIWDLVSSDVEGDRPNNLVTGTSADISTLLAIAQTFTTLRDIDASVEVYQQMIALTTSLNKDPTAQQTELAELHLAWFQFAEAADIYLALLSKAKANQNPSQTANYLERLVYSYQQAHSLTNALRAQTDLIEIYQAQGQREKLPGLLVAIAQNYRALDQPDNAIDYYRSAYSAAQRFEQFSFSAQVLQDLGALYQTLDRQSEALEAYTLLVPVEQQAYNNYGVMNAYDNIGQLQRRQGNSFEALQAFEQALVIANQLNLRPDYFIEQIESIAQSTQN